MQLTAPSHRRWAGQPSRRRGAVGLASWAVRLALPLGTYWDSGKLCIPSL